MEEYLQDLKTRLIEINDLSSAYAVLQWDQATYLPPAGAPARGRQAATLGRLAHEKFTDAAIGHLLDALQPYAEQLPYDSDDAALIRLTRRDYERAIKVPPAFMAELYQHSAQAYEAWAAARPANDLARVIPYLEKTLDLSRRYAEHFPGYASILDPLIHESDYGMDTATLQALFAKLRAQLVPLVQQITARPVADDSCLK